MASIVKKIIRGRPYYYARVCKRVDGKPKIVSQTYLGRADKIVEKLRAGPAPAQPLEAVVREFGASAALLSLARRLQLVEHIDRHLPKRGSGPSVGNYLLAAVLNRCLAPGSKASLARWFDSTVLTRLLPLRSKQLTSQRFWDHMHRVPVAALPAIERDIVAAMTREFRLDLRQVLFDATNFFTYIDTFNERSELAQRGHSKEGRKSLRIIGVALLVTTDFRLPLLHRTYPGNRPDPPTFQSLAADLARRYRELAAGTETVTLVFDKGNNSRENLDWVERSPFHFIGSLVPTQHPHLLDVSVDEMRSLEADGLAGVRAHRTESKVFGVRRTVLVTWNQRLFDAQCRTLLREIEKRRQHLGALQRQLRRWRDGKIRGGRKPGLAGTQKKVDGWLRARHMRDLFAVQVREVDGLPKVNYRFQRRAWETAATHVTGQDPAVHRPGGLERRRVGARLPRAAPCGKRLPAAQGQRLHRDPAAIPLDRSEDRGARVLLRAGADAVWPAAAGTEPARCAGIDPRVAGRAARDPRGRCAVPSKGGSRRARTPDDALADDRRTACDVRHPGP